jgi:hypothetical protein
MDDTVPQPSPANWSAPVALVVTTWVLAAAALAYTVFGADTGGRILTAVATIGLAVFALFGTVARPRLSVDADGVEIRRLLGRQRLPWRSVRIRVSSTRRFGRQVSLLELDSDTGDEDDAGLIVLGWLDLGTEPENVAAAIRAYWR